METQQLYSNESKRCLRKILVRKMPKPLRRQDRSALIFGAGDLVGTQSLLRVTVVLLLLLLLRGLEVLKLSI